MSRLILSLVVWLSLAQFAGATRYEISPFDLGEGFRITGGFIETDGTIGVINPVDLLDFRIRVAGPSFYGVNFGTVFDPPAYFYSDHSLVASNTELRINAPGSFALSDWSPGGTGYIGFSTDRITYRVYSDSSIPDVHLTVPVDPPYILARVPEPNTIVPAVSAFGILLSLYRRKRQGRRSPQNGRMLAPCPFVGS